jgi:hypothetical protein
LFDTFPNFKILKIIDAFPNLKILKIIDGFNNFDIEILTSLFLENKLKNLQTLHLNSLDIKYGDVLF